MNSPLDLTVAPRARRQMLDFLANITEFRPTLCLIKGRADGETEDRWAYGAYGPADLEALVPEFQQRGNSLLYEFDGLVAAVAQTHLIPELAGKVLDLGSHGLVVSERENGA